MAIFSVERSGYPDLNSMMQQVIEDMVDHGFTVVFPEGYVASDRSDSDIEVVLQAGVDVDALAETQPWRVKFQTLSSQNCRAFVGTPLQIADDGTVSTTRLNSTRVKTSAGEYALTGDFFSGEICATEYLYYSGSATIPPDDFISDDTTSPDPSADKGFISRSNRLGVEAEAGRGNPLTYRLTITDHGFFLGAFEGNFSSGAFAATKNLFNWFLVQRPVNKNTGVPLITGKAPLFCVSGINGKYRHFVVRESDISHPSKPVISTEYSEDSFKILNAQKQISITEDKKYIVSFIHNLNTPRFRYEEELDLVATVSADILIHGIEVEFSAYGVNRKYISMPGNNNYNTGMRILVLTDIPAGG